LIGSRHPPQPQELHQSMPVRRHLGQ
jgi:hypothetical protein